MKYDPPQTHVCRITREKFYHAIKIFLIPQIRGGGGGILYLLSEI
jgi:hypothetical protein